jgi:tRNA-specific 2-thiouridylase
MKKVLVAMSGGVDSSVAAALLQEQGYQVSGATIQMWHGTAESPCSREAVEDASRVADSLGIPFYTFDMEEVFHKEVIDYFVKEYTLGRTPNPCIQCNRRIKFGQFFHIADELGVDFIATGHYARIVKEGERRRLLRGLRTEKDQSYFLYPLTEDKLKRILFPVGDYTKNEIRLMAKRFQLKIADKPDSQEICFVPGNDYKDFLRSQGGLTETPGDIVDTQGNVIGCHDGVFNFTIGQRRGLGVSQGTPLYVLDINAKTNTIVVGSNEETGGRVFTVDDFTWISGSSPGESFQSKVQIRYNAQAQPANVRLLFPGRVRIEFFQPQRAVAPGQAAVIYAGEEVLGGGKITERLL